MTQPAGAKQEWKASWPLALACLAGMAVGSFGFYSIGALIAPLEAEFGWSRAAITLGLTISTVSGALLAPVVGLLLDRWGPRRVAIPGAILALVAFAGLSLTTDDIVVWLGLWFLISLGGLGVMPTVWTTAIASSFDKARGLALAVALCGSSVMALTMPILSTWLIDSYGWRSALPIQSVVLAVVSLPIIFFGLRNGASTSATAAASQKAMQIPSGVNNVREALLTPQFIKLAAAAFIFTACAIGLVTSLIPVISSLDFDRIEAAAIASLLGIASFSGRLLTGYLIDKYSSNIVAGSLVVLPVISCVMLLNTDGNLIMASAAVLLFGLALGAEVDVVAYLAAEKFGTARFGTIFGFITSSWYLATAVGPLLVSLVFDMTGTYELALKTAIPLFAVTSVLLFTLGKPLTFAEAEQT